MKTIKRSTVLTSLTSLTTFFLFTEMISAEIILPGRCYQGNCHETLFQGKTLLEQGLDGSLYVVEIARRSFRGGSEAVGDFGATEEVYVYCSTTQPAYIRSESPSSNSYLVSFLNPGGQPSGAFMSVYPIYWTTCHNLIGPEFNIDENRAREMGYPLNIRESQTTIEDPRDILN